MPKPPLFSDDAIIEREVIETLLAGLKEWRPDLAYPESHSDMSACVRGLLKMFDVKRKPLVSALRIRCDFCEGIGKLITKAERGYSESTTCKECHGRGWTPGN